MKENMSILKDHMLIIIWDVPLPSNSHHQDYYIFSRESRTKPSFVTVTDDLLLDIFSHRILLDLPKVILAVIFVEVKGLGIQHGR